MTVEEEEHSPCRRLNRRQQLQHSSSVDDDADFEMSSSTGAVVESNIISRLREQLHVRRYLIILHVLRCCTAGENSCNYF